MEERLTAEAEREWEVLVEPHPFKREKGEGSDQYKRIAQKRGVAMTIEKTLVLADSASDTRIAACACKRSLHYLQVN